MKDYKIWTKRFGFLWCILMMISCKSELAPVDYVNWVKDSKNGLHKTKSVGMIATEVQYKPLEYIITNELRKKTISKEEYEKRKEELEGLQYYTLKLLVNQQGNNITSYQVSSDKQQQERLYYLSYKMKDDLYIIEGEETFPCKLFHFERSYDMANHRTFVLGFEQKDVSLVDKTFVLDSPIFGTGPIKIKFLAKDLKNIPLLKLQ